MKHDYVLTVRFSTKQPIDKICAEKTFELIGEVGDAIRKALDIYHLTIKSCCLKIDEQSLAKQDVNGNWRLRKGGAD